MRQRLAYIIVLIGVLLLSGCSDQTTATPAPTSTIVNLLVAVEGQAQLKREGWTTYTPVDFGTRIYPTDLLTVEGAASVLCADLSIKPVAELGRCPCPVEHGWLEYKGFRFDSLRGVPQEVPYILYPRHTLVLDAQPWLRWHATGGVSYTISIMSGGREIWSQADVTSNMLRYPADAPILQPGIDYLLVVRDNATGRASTEEGVPGIGFRVIDAATLETVGQRRAEIQALPLDTSARDLALALYYAGLETGDGHGLWGEAWLLLESVVQTRPTPAVQVLLGDVLAALQLPREAEEAYRDAYQNAEALGDLESQAAALEGLCRVTGDTAQCDQARELYQMLGDARGE